MTNLGDFGGGLPPDSRGDDIAHDTRSDRAKHRRAQYAHGRCRAIATSKGCRCGGGVSEAADGALCHYHATAHQPVTIDAPAGLLARWCGQRATTWGEIPDACRAALRAVDSEADERGPGDA